ncbi:protein of unknown function [Taphrina deformans PYCC 5710]|uniref:CUE domain-containing protein n=1 Tax=Taphrina deformans (strain PYCC 5710 / ATCC 11124 / CBS 356.35 / IMI 108563 / JCM 9778 / NBRC 8474) TaxID=1097556 RepID=R4XEY2_TAPDE|nr:protein of unknown function [Taphrina deformans PYCC 5710]|eukprot:CCG83031.1 protein of unknown function [Taphrina deformans PYCC 5710]
MQRNDTTARKWNTTRPTYDEDWSDDEYAEETSVRPSKLTIAQQPVVKAPWEIELDVEAAHIGAATTTKTSDSGLGFELAQPISTIRTEPTNIEVVKRVYSLHDRPVRSKSPEVVHDEASKEVSMKRSSARRSLLPEDLPSQGTLGVRQSSSPPSAPTHGSAPVVETSFVAEQISLEGDSDRVLEAEESFSQSSAILSAASSISDAESNAFANEDENMRLEALMFNPENLAVDEYSDDERDAKASVLEDRSRISDQEQLHDRARVHPSTNIYETPLPNNVPDFPEDFKKELKSRALSDAILETYHPSLDSHEMRRSVSDDKHEIPAIVTAERTPSIVLTTNAWAEKSRLLKEQLEKNKKMKEESQKRPLVRESTYDHEYDYQTPIARIQSPMRSMEMPLEPIESDHAAPVTNYHEPQAIQVLPNLNTLLEEEEEEEVRLPMRASQPQDSAIQRAFTPPVPSKEVRATRTPETIITNKRREVSTPILSPGPEPSTSPIESKRPESAKSYDTNKSLPPIAPELSSTNTSEPDSGSDGEDSIEDDTLSPEQEYAMLKSLEAATSRPTTATAKDKDLPPLIQDSPKSRNTDLPAIRTSLDNNKSQITRLAPVTAEYTPSEYSAMPSAGIPKGEDTLHRPVRDRTFDLLPSLPVTESFVLHGPVREKGELDTRPTSKVWEPLRAHPKVQAHASPPKIETSRFSSSTIQSNEPDDYHFDMRDSFNPAIYNTLQDNPYYSDDDSHSNTSEGLLTVPDHEREHSLRSSTSVATLQPALRHMQSSLTINPDASLTGQERESERLADELLQQLSVATTRTSREEPTNVANSRSIQDSAIENSLESHDDLTSAPQSTTTHGILSGEQEELTPSAKFGARGRTASTGSKFLEVMSPMTSMEQTRATANTVVNTSNCQAQSADLLRYKDIKQLPTSQQRTAEYRRRTKALQESSSGLREYLSAIELHFKQENRSLPGPAPRTEFKSNKTIIPDMFVPNDLSRTTARIGDKGKDAAKELLSKSTRGLKGLFHSNSRSVSGSKKPNISLPLESKKQDRRVSLFNTRSVSGQNVPTMTTAPQYQQSLMPPSTPQSPQNTQLYSPIQNQSPHQLPARVSSPASHRGHQSPVSNGRDHMSATSDSPEPDETRHSSGRPISTIARIKTYFPDLNDRAIEDALLACDLDEQRAIGYLVVHRQGR